MGDLRFDLAASALRSDASDTRSLLDALAAKLEAALPAETRVERRAAKRFSKDKHVTSLEVRLGDALYAVSLSTSRALARRSTVVRGIVIKSDELSLDAWLDALSSALRHEAQRSEATRLALEKLLD